jgi:RimJ/RimL family protein N-acetyltransferase
VVSLPFLFSLEQTVRHGARANVPDFILSPIRHKTAVSGHEKRRREMFARTERLMLRPGWIDDALPLRNAIAHEDVAFTLARLPWPYTLGDAQWFLSQDRRASEANFLIFERGVFQPQLIGGIGIHDHDGAPEIGYWIAPSHWGKGYATEAGRAVVEIARSALRLPRLTSGHFADNPASGSVLRKLGFTPTGQTEMRMCLARGRERACVLYQKDFEASDSDERDPMQIQPHIRLAA